MRRILCLLSLLLSSCSCYSFGEAEVIQTQEDAYSIKYYDLYSGTEQDKYLKTGAALFTLDRGYTHFTVQSESKADRSLYPVPYSDLQIQLYKDNPPPDALDAASFLKFNPPQKLKYWKPALEAKPTYWSES